MKALLKKKLDSAVAYAKTNPFFVGYVTGAVATAVGTTILITYVMKDAPLVDMEAAAERILDEGLKGLYWETSKGTIIAFLNETLENPITDFK